MECSICAESQDDGDGFHCVACARAALYPRRLDYARALLDRNHYARQIQQLHEKAGLDHSAALAQASASLQHHSNLTDIQKLQDRIESILAKSARLRDDLEEYRREIERKKHHLQHRRREQKEAKAALAKGKSDLLDPTIATALKYRRRNDRVTAELISGRTFLCRESSLLAGLCRVPTSPLEPASTFRIAGHAIPDLRELNNLSVLHINSMLTQVARLLTLTCDYLSIRLPAEIIVPHWDWPLPAILPPSASYTNADLSFLVLKGDSPSASRLRIGSEDKATKPPVRPRPLFLDRPLLELARDDSVQYALFLEGVSLLAWDVAWLCRTQGIPVAEKPADWAQISAIGSNLYSLFIEATGKQRDIDQSRQASIKAIKAKRKKEMATNPAVQKLPQNMAHDGPQDLPNIPQYFDDWTFGVRSHDTSFARLPSSAAAPVWSAGGFELRHDSSLPFDTSSASSAASSRLWPFAQPQRFRDALRQHLATGADWELLEEGELRGMAAEGDGAHDADMQSHEVLFQAPTATVAPGTSVVMVRQESRAGGPGGHGGPARGGLARHAAAPGTAEGLGAGAGARRPAGTAGASKMARPVLRKASGGLGAHGGAGGASGSSSEHADAPDVASVMELPRGAGAASAGARASTGASPSADTDRRHAPVANANDAGSQGWTKVRSR